MLLSVLNPILVVNNTKSPLMASQISSQQSQTATTSSNLNASNLGANGKWYFCLDPVNDTCKTGFQSLRGYKQHRNAKHPSAASKLLNVPKYPFIPEVPVSPKASTTYYYYFYHYALSG